MPRRRLVLFVGVAIAAAATVPAVHHLLASAPAPETAPVLAEASPTRAFPDPPEDTIYTRGPRPRGGKDAMLWLWAESHWPYGPSLPVEVLDAIAQDNAQRPDESTWNPNKALEPWQYVGDVGMDVRSHSGQRYSGRITDVRTFGIGGVRVATPNGGLWEKSGAGWVRLTNGLQTLAVGSFDILPSDAKTMIMGTGDFSSGSGVGMFRTTDGGSNWVNVGFLSGGVYKVRYEPAAWGTTGVHAACWTGHFRSGTSGDPGSWSNQRNVCCTDLAFDPSTPGLMFAGFTSSDSIADPGDRPEAMRGGLFRSTDYGVTWQRATDPDLPDSTVTGRVSVTVCTNQPQTVYALFAQLTVTVVGGKNDIDETVRHLYRSDDRGLSWAEISIPSDIDDDQGDYNHTLAVNPDDPDLLLVGGVKLYRSTDGGGSWSERDVHADQHGALWVPGGGTEVLAATDGGLYHSTDDGQNWDSTYNALPITQYEDIDVCWSDPAYIVGGAQDNGLSVTRDAINWEVFKTGDGGGLTLRPNDCDDGIAAVGVAPLPKLFHRIRTSNAWGGYSDVEDGIADNKRWYPEVRWARWLDLPYTNTEEGVYRLNETGGGTWIKLNTTAFADPVKDVTVDDLGEAVYVTFDTGVQGDRIQVYQDGAWADRDLGDIPDNRLIRRIRPHPTTGFLGDAYLVTTNAASAGPGQRVFKTDNYGVKWTDISASLGFVIANDVIGHPTDPNQVYVATDKGMVWTPDGGTDWFNANTGMEPATTIRDLYVVPDPYGAPGDYWLYAGTFSNGVYRRRISAGVPGPPDPTTSVAVGADSARAGLPLVTVLAYPDGSGPTLADEGVRILVQVLDANSVPVPGIDPSRLTLHPDGIFASTCGYISVPPVTADAPTGPDGWTSFSARSLPWGGNCSSVYVALDGATVSGAPAGAAIALRVVSPDLNADNRVDLLDLERYNDWSPSPGDYRVDFNADGTTDAGDEAILRAAMDTPTNCPYEAPTLGADDGQLGLFFDEAGTQFGQIVFSGGEFDLYVRATGVSNAMRGIEFRIDNLDHYAVEILDEAWLVPVDDPDFSGGDSFRVVFGSPLPGPGDVNLLRIHGRLDVGAHVPFRLTPLAAPSFGTPTLPGQPGYIDYQSSPARHPFPETTDAALNPFPAAVYQGLQVRALGAATLLDQSTSLLIQGLDSVTGGGIHASFQNVHVPGAKALAQPAPAPDKAVPAAVDGGALLFWTTLDTGNTQDGATIALTMVDADSNAVVRHEAVRNAGLWDNVVTMPAISAQSYRLQLRHQGQTVLDDPTSDGTFATGIFLPAVYAVVLANGEFVIDQDFGQEFVVIASGNQYLADQIELSSQTQGAAGPGLIDGADLEGTLLPDIALVTLGIQRFGDFFSRAENAILASEDDRVRTLLVEAALPASIVLDGLGSTPVDLHMLRPRPVETAAAVDVELSDGANPIVTVGLRNGATVAVSADLSALGGSGWTLKGSLGGVPQWTVSGRGTDLAAADRWPDTVRMGSEGPQVVWPSAATLTGLAGASLPVDLVEIVPDAPVLPVPAGTEVRVVFSGMAEAAFAPTSLVSPVPAVLPTATTLDPNVPNPFNPYTDIRFTLVRSGHVSLTVYDLRGRLVRRLWDGDLPAGPGSVRWDGRTDAGAPAASGVYHALLRTPERELARKMVLVK